MSPLETLGFALGTSFASGLNLYATVAAAGLFQRFGIVTLPEPLQILANPVVLGIAADAVSDRVHRRQDPLRGQRLGRAPHLHPPACGGAAVVQRVRRRRSAGGVEARGRAARGRRGPHLARRQGEHPGRGEREPRAGQQLDAEPAGGRLRGVSRVDGGGAPAAHRHDRGGAGDPGGVPDLEAVQLPRQAIAKLKRGPSPAGP